MAESQQPLPSCHVRVSTVFYCVLLCTCLNAQELLTDLIVDKENVKLSF